MCRGLSYYDDQAGEVQLFIYFFTGKARFIVRD